MEGGLTTREVVVTTAAIVRDAISRRMLGDEEEQPDGADRLGRITLRLHQVEAVTRLRGLIEESGGAMLADEVGLGKTYVALALARDAARVVVVAPAALLSMWRGALERAGCRASLVSFERLSRATDDTRLSLGGDADLVVVDEAHHVRTPATRRYGALAALCQHARVLLLSATPLHNSRRDLAAQLALFLGAAAWSMDEAGLARYVVRRTRNEVQVEHETPVVAAPVWVELAASDDCLDALLGLPPPLPARGAGDGGALLVYSLVRQWASSRAALRAALRRRLARAVALTAALEAGCYPSRAQLAAWSYAEGSVQLAFPELVAAGGEGRGEHGEGNDVLALLDAVRSHERAVRDLLARLRAMPDPDDARAAAIRMIRSSHSGQKLIAFAEYAETVDALFARLHRDGGVAMLRARGARVSGGALSRAEAIARFAPLAQQTRAPHPSQRIDVMLATDLLSEGVNLQDASVVVHLDLPWNPARLEQRVGRVSRLGSRHARVSVYAVRPPAAAERLLDVERRLRDKLATAGRAVGVVGAILPGIVPAMELERGAAVEQSRIVAMLRQWAAATGRPRAPPQRGRAARPPAWVAAVASPRTGFIAVVEEGGRPVLLASLDGADPSTAPATVAAGMGVASATDVAADRRALDGALEAVERWLARRAAAALAGIDGGAVARARRRLLARITRVAARAPRHLRSVLTPLAADARRTALMPLGEGAERVLAELAEAPMPDQAWLRAVSAFGQLHGRTSAARRHDTGASRGLIALLLLLEG